MRRVLIMLGFVLLVGQPLSAQETIGPFLIRQAPVSATGSVGGVWWADWGNVVNVPVTINEAFSGFSIIDDGWLNIATGDFYEVTFDPPVVNALGPDIVVFEARYDSGAYTLSTSYDGFTASWVPAGWIDSGETRLYYYGGIGPYTADIWGSEVDLSNVGVPEGVGVSAIRLIATNVACDPLGVGAILEPALLPVEVPTLSPAGLIVLTVVLMAVAVLFIRRRAA